MTFMKNKKLVALSVLLGVLLIFVTAPFAGATSQAFSGEPDPAVIRDAEVYAEYEGVTVQEALHRFRLIEIAGPLHSELYSKEADTFGDGWIENGPQFKIVVQFTQNGQQTMQPYLLKYPELAPFIEIRVANISYRDLIGEQAKLMSELYSIGIPADSEPDIKTGRIRLYVVDQSALTQAIGEGLISIPENVDIIPVSRLTQLCTDVIGGHLISASGQLGTTGFGAKDGSTRVITTAGHIAWNSNFVNALYDGSITLYFYAFGFYGGRGSDIAWYRPQSGYVTNRIQDSPSTTRGIIWVEDYGAIWTGEYIFKYGQHTGSTVGQVSVKGYYQNYYSYYVRVETISGQPLCAYRDSGAPCYRGYIAIGSLVGVPATADPDPNDMIFYSVSKLSSEWGVNVLTEP